MIKTTSKLYCDHCDEEIKIDDNMCVVSQGRLINLSDHNLLGQKDWHFHLTCYDESRVEYRNPQKSVAKDKMWYNPKSGAMERQEVK